MKYALYYDGYTYQLNHRGKLYTFLKRTRNLTEDMIVDGLDRGEDIDYEYFVDRSHQYVVIFGDDLYLFDSVEEVVEFVNDRVFYEELAK